MTDLITRLSKLDAPDREVDAEIAKSIGGLKANREFGMAGNWWDRWTDDGLTVALPEYTTSVDAAIALAERVLHESVARRLIVFNSSPAKAGFDGTPERGKIFYFEAATPAIAACIALLRAKEAERD